MNIDSFSSEEEKGLGSIKNKNSFSQIEQLISGLNFPFCKVNSYHKIEYLNQPFQDITAHKMFDLLGKYIFLIFKDEDQIKNFINKITNSKDLIEERLILLNRDNNELPVNVLGQSFKDEEGYFLVLTKDGENDFEKEIEKRVNLKTEGVEKEKERMDELEKVLEIRVNARTRQLQEIAEFLEEKTKKRTEALEEKTKELEKRAKMEEGSRTALLNLAEDLEEASQEAKKEKDKTLAIVNNFTDGLLFFDSNKNLILINPQGEKLFGVKSENILNKRPSEIKEINKKLEKLIDKVGDKVERIFREEITLGEDNFLEVTSVLVERKNEEIGTLVIIHDITREKRVERMKTEFVSLAAHQLRTPLAGIKWSLITILEEKEESGILPEVYDLIEKAYEANERMVLLVNDLLNVTRMEEGNYVYEPKKVNIKEIVDLALDEYKDLVESRGLKFTLEQPEERLPYIIADMEELSLVVKNFFDNALKYTKEGEIKLKVEQVEGENKLKVIVSDTGVGIPENQKDKMFNKFFRAENVQLMDTEGSGLGLFISKNIVEAHGGEMGFESQENEGSSFFFTIPTCCAKGEECEDHRY
jgi:PAS domain S-box-containing protein